LFSILSTCILHILPSTLFPYTTLFRSCYSLTLPRAEDLRERAGSTTNHRFRAGSSFAMEPVNDRSPAADRTSNFQVPTERLESRSEEYTSELQSRVDLVCRLLLEKKTQ